MEKIAIFDTAGGNPTPTPPITTSAESMIYGSYGFNSSVLLNTDSGFCNLMGGGIFALYLVNDESVKGNVFLANYDIVTDFYISFGAITGGGGVADIDITLFENGSDIEDFGIINTAPTTVKQIAFTTFNQFRAGNAYCLRFSISSVGVTAIQILGWTIGVKFNSLP
jgi:hypothetical protein